MATENASPAAAPAVADGSPTAGFDLGKWIAPVISLILILATWQAAVTFLRLPRFMLPPPEMRDLGRLLSASRLKVFFKVTFPSAMPYFFDRSKVAISLAVIGAVIGGDQGFGQRIVLANGNQRSELAFAAILRACYELVKLVRELHWIRAWKVQDGSGIRVT